MTRIGITTTVPAEVIWAAGGIPVDLNNRFIAAPERDRLIAAAERDGYPRTICAWIKGIYGALATSKDIDTVVAVTEGDCSNTHALMETLQLRGIRTIPFAYPYRRDPARLAEEIEHLAQAMGTTTEAAERVRISVEPLRRKLDHLDDLTWRTGQVTGGENHRWLVASSDFEGDGERFSTKLDAFLARAEDRPVRETEVRLAYIGVPPVYDDLYEVIEGYGGGVVFNEVQRQFSLPRRTDSLVGDYLAYTYPYDVFHRLEYILPELERRSVQGVVHYVQSFCHRHIEDVVMRNRIPLPVLTLEGENPGRVDERTKVRIQAFIEMVSARRQG